MKRVIWCDRAFFPVYYGFCPSESAWKRETKRFKVTDAPYPQQDGRVTFFEKGPSARKEVAAIVTIHEAADKMSAVSVMALISHEAAHIWQKIREEMGEHSPSPEFEAYAIQDIVLKIGAAYVDTRKPKWAGKKK